MNMLYENEKGKKIFDLICKTIKENGMQSMIERGVILGLSGGADSVMLFYTLVELKKLYGEFSINCVHVNHMIRGIDADKDEEFCRNLCESLCVPLTVHRIDVPKIAKENGLGMEEAARNVRYSIFEKERTLLSSDACIAVAHNATDNLETIIFNMMRGTGITGLAGIKAVRENIIRPLIAVSKEKIVDFLNCKGISFVTDKTNFESEYSRNYIRNDILPLLKRLTSEPEESASRVSKNLRDDISFIDCEVDKFLAENFIDERISIQALKDAPKAIFSRVLAKIAKQKSNLMPEYVHINKIYELVFGTDFEYSLPGKVKFVSRNGYASITEDSPKKESTGFYKQLSLGVNEIDDFNNVIIISDDPSFESYINVYKIEIQATLSSDIIIDELFAREKRDGDSYFYGGITHKLKKMFVDKKIPIDMRTLVPVICDSKGIAWVPGFGVRNEESGQQKMYIAIAKSNFNDKSKNNFYITKRN